MPTRLAVYLALDIWFMPNTTCSGLANMVWVRRNKLEMKPGSPCSLSTGLPGWGYTLLNFCSIFCPGAVGNIFLDGKSFQLAVSKSSCHTMTETTEGSGLTERAEKEKSGTMGQRGSSWHPDQTGRWGPGWGRGRLLG